MSVVDSFEQRGAMNRAPTRPDVGAQFIAPRGPGEYPTGWGWYLYGITHGTGPGGAELAGGPGLDGGLPVQLLPHGQLIAIVSPVRLDELGAEAIRSRLQDMAWLEAMVRGHERVVETVQRARGILPARFGCVYVDTQALAEALERTHDDLIARLEGLAGCDEWGIRLYANRQAFQERVSAENAAVRQIEAELATAQPGRAYFLRRKLSDVLAKATEEALDAVAQADYDHLSRYAVAGHISPPHTRAEVGPSRGLHPARGDVEILRAAFLVRRSGTDRFVEEAGRFAEGHAGLRCEYSGPWPPYSFASIDGGGHPQ